MNLLDKLRKMSGTPSVEKPEIYVVVGGLPFNLGREPIMATDNICNVPEFRGADGRFILVGGGWYLLDGPFGEAAIVGADGSQILNGLARR